MHIPTDHVSDVAMLQKHINVNVWFARISIITLSLLPARTYLSRARTTV